LEKSQIFEIICFWRNVFFFELDPTCLCGWAGPSQPSLVTGPCQWPAQLGHWPMPVTSPSRLCMNSAKVIKLPSHCSSSFSQIARMKKNRVLQLTISGVGFMFFYMLTCIILFAGTENGSKHTWFWEGEDDGGWCEPRDHTTHTQRHQFPESQVNQVW